jgi:Tol biopolymer transport system component
VTFHSSASNLVSGDNNNKIDTFVFDCQTKTMERVSVTHDGYQADGNTRYPSISYDGRFVAFEACATNLVSGDENGARDIIVHDRQLGGNERVSVSSQGVEADGYSYSASISPNGRIVAFESYASNLVSGDANNKKDIFVHDRYTGKTSMVSLTDDETPGTDNSEDPSISTDGRFVAYSSLADNLVPDDTNNRKDVFIRDRGEIWSLHLPLLLNP